MRELEVLALRREAPEKHLHVGAAERTRLVGFQERLAALDGLGNRCRPVVERVRQLPQAGRRGPGRATVVDERSLGRVLPDLVAAEATTVDPASQEQRPPEATVVAGCLEDGDRV